jgi:hypothetical protein
MVVSLAWLLVSSILLGY